MSEERWRWLREQTPVTKQYAYMNSGFSGPISRPVVQAMEERLQLELDHGPTTRHVLEGQRALSQRFREVTAEMIGADADEIAIMGNTTEGLNVAVNGMRFEPGDEVVTTSVEHSSGLVPAYYLRERHGMRVEIAPLAADDSPGEALEKVSAAIGPRTKLVLLSEISYSTGQLLPLAGIVQAAHRAGARVVVDGAQTAGHVPIDVRASGVDCYALPSHKWLCGPDGLGALYVRRDVIPEIEPLKVAGRAAASYDFEGNFEPERDNVTKYELTTVSGALLAGTVAATELYLASGPQAVWERVCELTRYAEDRFQRIDGVTVTSPRSEGARSGLFLFAVANVEPRLLAAYLQQGAKVVCRAVAQYDSVRLSLHCFNTEAEIDGAAETVERAVRDGIPDDVELPPGPPA